ncbi:hypothetical protein COX22_01365 [Candidatus Falkowbacteria bacterium CG23_combo_of_CG06-09_8_20_14_all_49_15]|uniref:Zinc finger DksA/TraR C4-type domain-containing protein n=1 Tax=Candidatus Falkowbacteria bacterium CG23_combo_of_CG06-09_8_20_14_all_49_15 TaxID=1974572 RepID=A0A2G9ZLI8_9BACT|nr:MAG: hypothetical protein COX22_01365 [Candidatus Falkowbacteria bacterium CG23_combo_of_CG06-09_8_20_14_all_49_15]
MTENKQIIAAEPLDQETIDKIKDGLLVRRQQIKEELKKITTADNKNDEPVKAKFPNYGNESDDNALEISDYTTNLATEKILQSALQDIESSLKRIEAKTYGICKYCGRPIGKQRMLARPSASACVECKTKLQKAL